MIWTKLKKDVILEKIKKGFILISVLSVLFQNGGGGIFMSNNFI